MREISKRIKHLEQLAGQETQRVYFIDAVGLSEAEVQEEIDKIAQVNPNAVFFLDDIPLDEVET